MTNCVNCGAIIRGNKCEYCGTEYNKNGISMHFNADDYMGTMKLGSEEIKVYINSMQGNICCMDSYRDSEGILHRNKPKMKRTFTVVEI